MVTVGALLIAIPFGVGTSVYISEVAPPWLNNLVKPVIEILAGLPSVVLGFLGIQVAAPFLRRLLDLPTGLSAFTGAVLLALIATPTIVSITEDALNTVPASYRQAALALGATRWQTIWGITVPAARSGILTAVMLGVGRSIGETMAVMMVTGNAAVLPHGLDALFMPVRTMTATIASEMGEVANGSDALPGAVLHRHHAVPRLAGDQHRGILGQPARALALGTGALMNRSLNACPLERDLGFNLLRADHFITVLPVLAIVVYIIIKGAPAISWEFLTAIRPTGCARGASCRRSWAPFT